MIRLLLESSLVFDISDVFTRESDELLELMSETHLNVLLRRKKLLWWTFIKCHKYSQSPDFTNVTLSTSFVWISSLLVFWICSFGSSDDSKSIEKIV